MAKKIRNSYYNFKNFNIMATKKKAKKAAPKKKAAKKAAKKKTAKRK
jgi:hypothetical protein